MKKLAIIVLALSVSALAAPQKDLVHLTAFAAKKAAHGVGKAVNVTALAIYHKAPKQKGEKGKKADGSGPIQTCRPGQSKPCGDYPPAM